MTFENPRIADHPANRIFLYRWSPRAFTGEAIPQSVLFTILEAARWAPSSYNSQLTQTPNPSLTHPSTDHPSSTNRILPPTLK